MRQVLGKTGLVSGRDVLLAAAHIRSNTTSGWFPTTGGRIPLLHREEVADLYRANRRILGIGLGSRFRPKLPDRAGQPARTLDEWYVAAIEQALFVGKAAFGGRQDDETDEFLSSYRGHGVDWRRIHTYAVALIRPVRPYGSGPGWTERREPLSVITLTGQPAGRAA